MDYSSEYIRFFTAQKFQGIEFNLFTQDEQIQLFNQMFVRFDSIPYPCFIDIFKLPFDELTVDCLNELIPLINKKIKSSDHISYKLIDDHINQYGPYTILEANTVTLIKLALESEKFRSSLILNKFQWSLPDNVAETQHLSVIDLIFLYRTFDARLLFPSHEKQEHLASLIIQRVNSINDYDERMAALEQLLFVKKIDFALSNIQLRNAAINLLVSDLKTKYGKDNNTSEYSKKMIEVITHLFDNVAKRDAIPLLSSLINAIESQWEITEQVGILLDPGNYLNQDNKNFTDMALGNLASISTWLGEDKASIYAFLQFISTPLTSETLTRFAKHVREHGQIRDLQRKLGYDGDDQVTNTGLELMLRALYAQFWNCTLQERSVCIEHLLIPASQVKTEKEIENAYEESFLYVIGKLLPNADTDKEEHLALALLKAYLNTADQHIRSHLLAGMLVASNQSLSGEKLSVAKKMAILCENLGPAYVKLAQAIHSYPSTPEHVRHDLEHLKGRANPPYRWQLWLRIRTILSKTDQDKIKRIGTLLGAASYNLALEAHLHDGQDVVLLMLREHAEHDAKKGFAHINATINACKHQDIISMRDSLVSINSQAREMSVIEMDQELSKQQYQIAAQNYNTSLTTKNEGKARTMQIHACKLISSGEEYRFIERVYGIEFNDLPCSTKEDKATRTAIAKAVMILELTNILRGGYFDSDRHGNQLRYENNTIGLYDFGEMSLTQPSNSELSQLANVLYSIQNLLIQKGTLHENFDAIMTTNINKAREVGESTQYLMRVRKALLALSDFQTALSNEDLMHVLHAVNNTGLVHKTIQNSFSYCVHFLGFTLQASKVYEYLRTGLGFFSWKSSTPRDNSDILMAEPKI